MSSSDLAEIKPRATVGQARWLPLVIALGLTLVYLWPHFCEGWIPHDEGMLGQTAQRVLQGEMPHRDFDDMYTGGLTYMHAAAMQLLGIRLSSMRWLLLGASLLCVACWYLIACRFVPPWSAMLASLVCLAWSLPNYFAALPSWYNVLLGSLVIELLLRYHEQRRVRWLLLAGLCCGLSMLVKIVGLYTLAATLLSVLAIHFPSREGDADEPAQMSAAERACSLAPAALLCLLVLVLIRQQLSLGSLLLFFLPCLLLGVLLARIQSGRASIGSAALIRQLAQPLLAVTAGMLLPVLLWLGIYAASGAVGDLLTGVFVLPHIRLASITSELPPLRFLLAGLPLLVLLSVGLTAAGSWVKRNPLVMIPAGIPLLLMCIPGNQQSFSVALYQPLFLSLYYLPIAVVLAGLCWSVRTPRQPDSSSSVMFIVLAPVALMTLIQYPYASGVYFCYYAPFLLLGLLAIVSQQPLRWQYGWLGAAVLYLGFALLAMNFSSPRALGVLHLPSSAAGTISARGDLSVGAEEGTIYRSLIKLIQLRTRSGEAIYATPDCPEIYFLADRRNPTRTLYDIFDSGPDRTERILAAIEAHQVRLIVLSRAAEFSRPLAEQPRFVDQLRRRFPNYQIISYPTSRFGPPVSQAPGYEVRWR